MLDGENNNTVLFLPGITGTNTTPRTERTLPFSLFFFLFFFFSLAKPDHRRWRFAGGRPTPVCDEEDEEDDEGSVVEVTGAICWRRLWGTKRLGGPEFSRL